MANGPLGRRLLAVSQLGRVPILSLIAYRITVQTKARRSSFPSETVCVEQARPAWTSALVSAPANEFRGAGDGARPMGVKAVRTR